MVGCWSAQKELRVGLSDDDGRAFTLTCHLFIPWATKSATTQPPSSARSIFAFCWFPLFGWPPYRPGSAALGWATGCEILPGTTSRARALCGETGLYFQTYFIPTYAADNVAASLPDEFFLLRISPAQERKYAKDPSARGLAAACAFATTHRIHLPSCNGRA